MALDCPKDNFANCMLQFTFHFQILPIFFDLKRFVDLGIGQVLVFMGSYKDTMGFKCQHEFLWVFYWYHELAVQPAFVILYHFIGLADQSHEDKVYFKQ